MTPFVSVKNSFHEDQCDAMAFALLRSLHRNKLPGVGTESHQPSDRSGARQWTFPGYPGRTSAGAESVDDSLSVQLASAPMDQARSICVRLESEGIPCSLAREPTGVAGSSEEAHFAVFVRQADVEAANGILSNPNATEEDNEENDNERLIDAWICPACRRRELVTLPRSKGWQRFKLVWLVIFGVPILVPFLFRIMPSPEVQAEINSITAQWIILWFMFVMTSAALFVFWPRGKRCTQCGWRSDGG
jgi:hypothetical protein